MNELITVVTSKPCAFCGSSFEPIRDSHKYCSVQCKRAQRARVRDEAPPPAFVGSYDLIPAHVRKHFTEGPREDCWIYGRRGPNGYASSTSVNRYQANAYRLIYMMMVGPIPDGMELHHTCHNGAGGCVNPFHLEPCTHAENMDKSHGIHQIHKRRTHCPRGHEYTPENTMRSRGRRYCRACAKEHTRRSRERHGEKYRANQRAKYHADPAVRARALERQRENRARKRAERGQLEVAS